MPKETHQHECTPAHSQRLPGVTAPSEGKAKGAVRKTHDAYQGERKEEFDSSARKPSQ